MTEQHRATEEQWAAMQRYLTTIPNPALSSCILELRDRVAALEDNANRQAILDSSPTPIGGLLERVANGISQANAGPGVSPDVREVQARAAIRAVAEHMENRRPFIRLEGWDQAIRWIREEVERHG